MGEIFVDVKISDFLKNRKE